MMKPFKRTVCYYETDKMAFVHHSNYIRWFEEARLDFLDQAGISYEELEAEGLLSPVLSLECEYMQPVKFRDTVNIEVTLTSIRTLKFSFSYKVTNAETGALHAKGKSSHCFIKEDGTLVSLKTYRPDIHEKLKSYLVKE